MWRTTAKWSEHVGAETGLTEEERAQKSPREEEQSDMSASLQTTRLHLVEDKLTSNFIYIYIYLFPNPNPPPIQAVVRVVQMLNTRTNRWCFCVVFIYRQAAVTFV